jgi:hypothetical protein
MISYKHMAVGTHLSNRHIITAAQGFFAAVSYICLIMQYHILQTEQKMGYHVVLVSKLHAHMLRMTRQDNISR